MRSQAPRAAGSAPDGAPDETPTETPDDNPDRDQPRGWLRRLLRLDRARIEWWPFARGVLGTGVPLAVGVATGQTAVALLPALAGLFATVGNVGGGYRAQFRALGVQALFAVAGYTAGQLLFGHELLAIPIVTAAALIAGMISALGATVSMASMLFLVLLIAASAVPSPHPIGLPALLYLAGAVFAALLLGAEALVNRRRPARAALNASVAAIAALASAIESRRDADIGPLRDAIVDRAAVSNAVLLDHRAMMRGRSRSAERGALILAALSELTPAILAAREAGRLPAGIAAWLSAVADAISAGRPLSDAPPALRPLADRRGAEAPEGAVVRRISEFVGVVGRGERPDWMPAPAPSARRLRDRLAPLRGRDLRITAVRIALCAAIGMVAMHFIPGSRSYWIPITVVMVLKPDFGSVFARAVQRSLGTIAGAAAGALILQVLPKGIALVAIIAICAGLLPWSARRSFALQGAILTSLVLVLFDLVVPATGTTDYWLQRSVDTIIASVIVLVFGYLIWPTSMRSRVAASFGALLGTLADFLTATCSPDPDAATAAALRRRAYGGLSNTRVQLQRALSEPPRVSRQAAAWYPATESAARLCDELTAEQARRLAGAGPLDGGEVAAMAASLRALVPDVTRRRRSRRSTGPTAKPAADASGPDRADERADGPIPAEVRRLTALVHALPG